jgi:hypothetical protein
MPHYARLCQSRLKDSACGDRLVARIGADPLHVDDSAEVFAAPF